MFVPLRASESIPEGGHSRQRGLILVSKGKDGVWSYYNQTGVWRAFESDSQTFVHLFRSQRRLEQVKLREEIKSRDITIPDTASGKIHIAYWTDDNCDYKELMRFMSIVGRRKVHHDCQTGIDNFQFLKTRAK